MDHAATSETAHPISPPVDGPDWSAVTDDVPCPLCEYNLRGVSRPRCPECGYRFEWEELLDADLRVPPFLYENHIGHRTRAFFRTLRAGLRPYRFWSTLRASHPVRTDRLCAYAILQWIVPLLIFLVTLTSYLGQQSLRNWRARQIERATLAKPEYARVAQSVIRQYGSMENYLDAVYPVTPWKALRQFGRPLGLVRSFMTIPVVIWAWPLLTAGAFCLFEISMKRARIRRVHVLRCVAYSADVVWWVGIATLIVVPVVAFARTPSRPWAFISPLALDLTVVSIFAVGLVVFAIRLHAAYRRYLRFPHAGWVVLSSQLIALLTTLNLILWATKLD